MAKLLVDAVTLDGQATVCWKYGYSNSDARKRARDAAMIAGDLLEHEGEDLRGLSFQRRRARLGAVATPGDGIALRPFFMITGDARFAAAFEQGLERIISKRLGSRYQSRQSTAWMKTEDPHFRR